MSSPSLYLFATNRIQPRLANNLETAVRVLEREKKQQQIEARDKERRELVKTM